MIRENRVVEISADRLAHSSGVDRVGARDDERAGRPAHGRRASCGGSAPGCPAASSGGGLEAAVLPIG